MEINADPISLDSSVILAYLFEGNFKDIIESTQQIFISTITLFEIKKKLLDKVVNEKEIKEKINYIKSRTLSVPLSDEIAEKAAELSSKEKLPAADSLVYASALQKKSTLLTLDNDFRNLENVKILTIN